MGDSSESRGGCGQDGTARAGMRGAARRGWRPAGFIFAWISPLMARRGEGRWARCRAGGGGGRSRRRARGRGGAARALRADAAAAQRLSLGEVRRRRLAEARGSDPVRSYKIRGAFNAMRKALAARPDRRRFVCASAGNHAQGMAYACRHFGAEGVVFMPVTTPQQKIDKTRQFGGGRVEIRLVGDYFDETLARGAGLRRRGRRALPAAVRRRRRDRGPGDLRAGDPRAAAGAATSIVVPVGGGGLSAGLVRVADALAPGRGGAARRARGRAEPAPGAGGGRARDAAAGRQLRRRRGGGADRRPATSRCSRRFAAGGRAARAGEPRSAPPWSRC